jgi:hypothetical protein
MYKGAWLEGAQHKSLMRLGAKGGRVWVDEVGEVSRLA